MSASSAPSGARGVLAAAISPPVLWALTLLFSPAGSNGWPGTAGWSALAAALVALVPLAIIMVLSKRGDLRAGLSRFGSTAERHRAPFIIGCVAAIFVTLRVLRRFDAPLEIAAVIFSMAAIYAVALVLAYFWDPSWIALSVGAVIAVLILLHGPWAWLAVLLIPLLLIADRSLWARERGRFVISGTLGAVVGGGVCAALLQFVP